MDEFGGRIEFSKSKTDEFGGRTSFISKPAFVLHQTNYDGNPDIEQKDNSEDSSD